jgi:hypothetical protein
MTLDTSRLRGLAALGIVAVAMSLLTASPMVASVSAPTWTIQAVPYLPLGASLLGVACPSGTDCLAVGRYLATLNPDVDHPVGGMWNGSSWVLQPLSPPTGGSESQLAAVSCTTTTSCVAVGTYQNAVLGESPLAEIWNGNRWRSSQPPSPTGATGDAVLSDISCTRSNSVPVSCEAVGWSRAHGSNQQSPLVEHWDGTTWTIVPFPSPVNRPKNAELHAVACSAAAACTALGARFNGSFWTGFAARWNGSGWTFQSLPTPRATSYLSVSCPASDFCMAVGSSNAGPDAPALWNGVSWSALSSPSTAQPGKLMGVSCKSAVLCEAVGFTQGSFPATPQVLVEGWEGSSWVLQSAPNPSPNATLNAIRCTQMPTFSCTAVGTTNGGLGAPALAERYS